VDLREHVNVVPRRIFPVGEASLEKEKIVLTLAVQGNM
jgi:hypothetical protein